MFCPKCGSQVPDGAAFCGQCGNKFEKAETDVSVTAQPAKPKAASGSSALRTNGAGIAAAVFAVLAIAISFAPWFDISSQMSTMGGAASGLTSGISSLFGGSSSAGMSFDFEDSYAVWSLVGLADTFKSYVDVYSSFGGSGAQGAATLIGVFAWGCLILWILALGFTVWGVVGAFVKGNMGILRVASIFMAATVVVFYVFAGAMSSDTGTASAMPMVCLICSIIGLVCSFAAKKKAA